MSELGSGGSRLWSIILAGGEGSRMTAYVKERFDCARPKQYCAFTGTRSMFQHTVDRAARIVPSRRIVIVVAKHHRAEVHPQLAGRNVGRVLYQPQNRDTAAGIFLPLTYVRHWDPEATVIAFPSDHFVFPESRFLDCLRQVDATVAASPDRVTLVAVPPDCVAHEYGWIVPGAPVAYGDEGAMARSVRAFIEKPSAKDAGALHRQGALWNTLIIVSRVKTLWELGWRHLPETMRRFERLAHAIDGPREETTLDRIYDDMPAANMSSDFLQVVDDHLAVVELQGVMWSDWGRPERVEQSLAQIRDERGMTANVRVPRTAPSQFRPSSELQV